MDDGRLVFCLPVRDRILICNKDGSQTDSIPIQGKPLSLTTVDTSTVAVTVQTLFESGRIEVFDINNKQQLQSISVYEMYSDCGITMMNNKLVVGGYNKLLIVDHQTRSRNAIRKIKTDGIPYELHASGDRIFFRNAVFIGNRNSSLSMYSCSDDMEYTMTLPSVPACITSLKDGRLYVSCVDGLMYHVSADLKSSKKVRLNNLVMMKEKFIVSYNTKQNKMTLLYKNILSICNELL